MEDGWESHVSPLVMGVGMSNIQGITETQASCSCSGHSQDMPVEFNIPHQREELPPHPELHSNMHLMHPDIGQELSSEMGSDSMRAHSEESVRARRDYLSHQVGSMVPSYFF